MLFFAKAVLGLKGGDRMRDLEYTLNDLERSLIWEQGLRLFAMTNLSEGNPFRKAIEEQTTKAIEDLLAHSQAGAAGREKVPS
jgi:hypothetical protein